jgi:NADH-quinone oxidoreductase subunit M
MTIFVGAFGAEPVYGDPNNSFRMVATIIACTSIVVTAVYILRVVGKILYGNVENKHYLELTDATWDERVAVICLIFCVAGLGTFPFWVSNVISPSAGTILQSIGVM